MIKEQFIEKHKPFPLMHDLWVDLDSLIQTTREKCARIVEEYAQDNETISPSFSGIAKAIRDSE